MDETKQPNEETKAAAQETARPDRHPRMVTPDMELVDETRDRIAQRRPDPSDKPRKAAEQPERPPWFLHPDERREFARLAQTSREMAAQLKARGEAAGSMGIVPEAAGGQIEALCEALERCLEADKVMQGENERLAKENRGLLDTVARWQDYGEGRIPQPPDDVELPELPKGMADPGRTDEQPAWEALYRRKVLECQQIQQELDEMRRQLERARETATAAPPPHVSYVVNFIAGREAATGK